MAIEMHKWVMDEYELVEGIINNPLDSQLKGVVDYYCGKINTRLIDRVNRYLLMNGVTNEEERIKLISEQLDKYGMLYNRQVIEKQLQHNFVPLRKSDERIKYYQSEIDAINSLGNNQKIRKFAFAILTYAKHQSIVYGEAKILNDDDLMVDLYRLCEAGDLTKEDIYLLVYELVKRDLLHIPISLDKYEKIEVKYVSNDEEEVVYDLANDDIFKMGEVFERIFGQFRAENQKTILEISLVEDYHATHASIGEAVKSHNQRTGAKINKGNVSRCTEFRTLATNNCAFVEIDFEDRKNTEYINRICNFIRNTMKPNYRRVNKVKGTWIITKDFMGAIDENGEVLAKEGDVLKKGKKKKCIL